MQESKQDIIKLLSFIKKKKFYHVYQDSLSTAEEISSRTSLEPWKGTVSIRPVLGLNPIFFLILLNDPCLVEWSNRLEDIFELSGWGNYSPPTPTNPTGDKQMHTQLYCYYII